MTERAAVDAAVDAVVFDVGNVLIEWDPRHLYRKIFRSDGGEPDDAAIDGFLERVCTPAWNVRQDLGRSIAEANAELIDRFPDHTPAIEAYYGRFQEMIPGAIGGTVAVFEELKAAGVPVHGLTNFGSETFAATRPRFDFLNRFDVVVVSGDEGVIKPDPRIYEILVERAGLDPARTAFVDDSPRNIEAARAMGFRAHLFREPEALRADWRSLGLPV